ncbi:MAG TPA: peptide chain release factor N(5)-glutamine methyltransferase [Lacipirellulaceae bacterium]|jgi:release factor glutamine methyltransferase|nr:peptide chain release factor N(5)-glutamine methyltransferase [Lacipirellulaceae bacterium]
MSNSDEPWTVGRLLSWTIDYLGKQGAENPRLDAEVLLAHARGCRRIDLYTSFGDAANEETRTAFRELVRRRAAGEPVAYLVGHREFYSLDFEVNSDVLIPRPETESLVVALLDDIKRRGLGDAPIEIADVGTGSGIIAICAAKYLSTARIKAIDISPAALTVAKRNAERHGVADRVEFVEADLLSAESETPHFDYVVSNPPYVATSEMEQLAVDVRDHEPDLALRAGEDGTDAIAPLIEQAATRLKPGGGLLIEVSPMIATAVEGLISAQSGLELGPTIKDLAGHARIIQANRRKED